MRASDTLTHTRGHAASYPQDGLSTRVQHNLRLATLKTRFLFSPLLWPLWDRRIWREMWAMTEYVSDGWDTEMENTVTLSPRDGIGGS